VKIQKISWLGMLLALGPGACGDSAGTDEPGAGGGAGAGLVAGGQGGTGGADAAPSTFMLPNDGTSNLEGHTPRGFQGEGTGLFAGDNLNPNFPDGDGVHFFLTFDLADVPQGNVVSATVRSANAHESGSPYADLGTLSASEIRFDEFSSALWDAPLLQGGTSCEFASSSAGPFECDLAEAVQRSLDDGYRYAQFRFDFELAGDGDGSQDLASFYLRDPNGNEPGIFELEVVLVPVAGP
jgi:hypothetical protein